MNEQLDKLLVSVNWKEFEIGELFDKVSIAPSSDMNALVSGDIPFVGRSSTGNGLQSEVSVEDTKVIDGNSITVGMVGESTAFYQKYSFTCSQNILVLQLNDNMNEHTAMFLNTVLNKHLDAKGYGYGHPVSLLRIRRDVILLPATPDGQPDWNFMQEYMMMVEQVVQPELDYTPHVVTDNRELDEVDWGTFTVGDVFSVNNSKAYHKSNLELHGDGAIPYITRTVMNNGLDSVICDDGELISNPKSIAFGAESAVFFYHDYNYVTGNKMYTVMLEGLNKYSSLFLVSVFNNNLRNGSFGYGRGLTGTRFKRQKVLLPIDSQGNPDWNFMEQYMKRMENKIAEQVS